MGIPESMLDEVFETFSQGRDQASPYSRDIEGSGLGLPLVKRLVRLMGGSLCISSQEQQGTTVYVSLPFQLLEAPGSGLCAEAVRESAATLTGYRVLVADDDPMSRKAAQMLLENQGCRVQLAQNGQAALQRLEEEQFDLVLMDVKMPVMDGMEATRRIRSSRPGLRSLPVIGMTAYAMSGDREHFLAAGMDDYIAKPIEKEMLLATISRHVSGA
jgi:CheY-like chemotaxis protein